jgi:hypothetical protein
VSARILGCAGFDAVRFEEVHEPVLDGRDCDAALAVVTGFQTRAPALPSLRVQARLTTQVPLPIDGRAGSQFEPAHVWFLAYLPAFARAAAGPVAPAAGRGTRRAAPRWRARPAAAPG